MNNQYDSENAAVAANDYVEVYTMKNSIGLYFYHLVYKKNNDAFYLRIEGENLVITEQMEEVIGCALYLMGHKDAAGPPPDPEHN